MYSNAESDDATPSVGYWIYFKISKMFDKDFGRIRHRNRNWILTSMPIRVGRRYKLACSVCGTHSWSIDTSRCIHLMNSSPSNVGKPERFADKFIRFIFIFGLNIRIRPSTPRYAFIPSNSYKISKPKWNSMN